MYETIKECPICQKSEFSNFIICNDHLVSDESFAIVQCENCSLKFTNPRPTENTIGTYYDSEQYASHKVNGSGLTDTLYNLARKYAFGKKINLLKRLQPEKGKVLDVGCGTGLFLNECIAHGWQGVGIENNSKAQEMARSNTSARIMGTLDELEGKKEFNAITLWHVLEHLHDLKGTLKCLRKLMKKDAHLVVAVPNCDSWDCKHYGDLWAGYDVPRHLYHFNQLTINKLAKECKLKLRETIPMTLDAYYVSLLSERYKTGKNNFAKAFTTGLKSNRWAQKNQNNYSSLIYIFTKK